MVPPFAQLCLAPYLPSLGTPLAFLIPAARTPMADFELDTSDGFSVRRVTAFANFAVRFEASEKECAAIGVTGWTMWRKEEDAHLGRLPWLKS